MRARTSSQGRLGRGPAAARHPDGLEGMVSVHAPAAAARTRARGWRWRVVVLAAAAALALLVMLPLSGTLAQLPAAASAAEDADATHATAAAARAKAAATRALAAARAAAAEAAAAKASAAALVAQGKDALADAQSAVDSLRQQSGADPTPAESASSEASASPAASSASSNPSESSLRGASTDPQSGGSVTEPTVSWAEPQQTKCGKVFGNGFTPLLDICDAQVVCEENELIDATICRFRDLQINLDKITVAPGGEPIDKVRWRAEGAEMCKYRRGAFIIGRCDTEIVHMEIKDKFPHHMLDVAKNVIPQPGELVCSNVVTTPTLLVTRYEYANIFHTMTDWYNVYQTIQMYGLQGGVKIVFLDGHSAGALDDAWPRLFNTEPVYVSSLPPGTCFKESYLVSPGYRSTLTFPKMQDWVSCPPSPFMKDFTRHFITSHGLGATLENDAVARHDPPRVLFLLRRNYLAHPRIRQTARVLANAESIVNAIRTQIPGVDLRPISFESMPISEQIAAVRDADILVSVHGAGLSHLIFMRPGTVVIELMPRGYEGNHHYDTFAAFVGVNHVRVAIPRDSPTTGITVNPEVIVEALRRQLAKMP